MAMAVSSRVCRLQQSCAALVLSEVTVFIPPVSNARGASMLRVVKTTLVLIRRCQEPTASWDRVQKSKKEKPLAW